MEQLLNLFQMQKKLLVLIQCQKQLKQQRKRRNNKIYNCSFFAGDMKIYLQIILFLNMAVQIY